MAIYQSEYLFMKKHFFSAHDVDNNAELEEEAKIDNLEGNVEVANGEVKVQTKRKTSSRKRPKSRKR